MRVLRKLRKAIVLASLPVVGALIVCPASCVAQEANVVEEISEEAEPDGLLPNWGRTDLEDEGYLLETTTVDDFWANVRGGNSRGVGVVGTLNISLTVDTTKAQWWDNGELVIYGLGMYGRKPTEAMGDFQFASSIEGYDEHATLYQAYYKHSFADETFTLLAGIRDFTLEFAVLDYGWDLLNSSFLTIPTITQEPYSFYPHTGLGAEASAYLADNVSLHAGVYDGEPTNLEDPGSRDWSISKRGGLYYIGELRWEEKDHDICRHEIALGAWNSTGTFEDVTGQERTWNFGSYLMGQTEVWREEGKLNEGLGLMAQLGQASSDRNFTPWYFGAVVRYKGPIPHRGADVISLGYNHAQISETYRSNNEGIGSSERVIEFAYRARVTRDIYMTPDIQYIMDPSGEIDLADDIALFMRTEVAL
jgi:porin